MERENEGEEAEEYSGENRKIWDAPARGPDYRSRERSDAWKVADFGIEYGKAGFTRLNATRFIPG
jgi:hypothetical protein